MSEDKYYKGVKVKVLPPDPRLKMLKGTEATKGFDSPQLIKTKKNGKLRYRRKLTKREALSRQKKRDAKRRRRQEKYAKWKAMKQERIRLRAEAEHDHFEKIKTRLLKDLHDLPS